MRESTQYETHLPPLPHTAPQLGQYPSGFPTFDDYQSRKTAPASLGVSIESLALSKFSSPAITPATLKLNQRLERLIRALGKSGSSSQSQNRQDIETENDERELKVVQFDKNWNELMHMIDYAKNLTENENSKESIMNLGDYNRGLKKTKHKKPTTATSATERRPLPHAVTNTTTAGLEPLPGKKPMRTIIADLQRKLQDYKNNSLEWEALQQRVDRFTGFGEKHDHNFLKKNRQVVGTLLPDVMKQKNAQRVERQKLRQLQVLHAKKLLDKKLLDSKLNLIKEKEKRLEQTLANEKDFVGSLSTIQAKWFAVVFVAVRVKKLQELVEKKHIERAKFLTFQHASIVIQRWYKSFLNAKWEIAKKNAKLVIGYHFKIYLRKWRAERLRKASFIVQLFFKEVYDVSKLLKVVKKYRFTVIKAQRIMRNFIVIRNARVAAITKFWDCIQGEWWSQRQRAARVSELLLDSSKDKLQRKATKSKKDENSTQRIPGDLKAKLILENLVGRRKIFCKAWAAEAKAWTSSADKHIPLFPLLPSNEEMFDMMEKGYEAHISNSKSKS